MGPGRDPKGRIGPGPNAFNGLGTQMGPGPGTHIGPRSDPKRSHGPGTPTSRMVPGPIRPGSRPKWAWRHFFGQLKAAEVNVHQGNSRYGTILNSR